MSPGGFEGCGFDFLSNPFESIDMFDKQSAASSIPFPLPTSPAHLFISLLAPLNIALVLPTEPGLHPSPSILLTPHTSLSNIRLKPDEEDGDGSGWELHIEIDLECGVCLHLSLLMGEHRRAWWVGTQADMTSSD